MSDQAQQPNGQTSSKPLQFDGIITPHDHDVLSGRGNFVNYHAGNEHFRALVKKHKMAYVACPKPQKGKFSRLIVDEIRSRDPPGRFLKQDAETKLWHDIGDKKALDKTRQALREGAPELQKELQASDGDYEIPTSNSVQTDVHGNQGFHAQTGLGHEKSMPPPAMVHSTNSLAMSSQMEQRMPLTSSSHRVVPGIDPMAAGSEVFSEGSQIQQVDIPSKLNIYAADQFEPTPINPNLKMKISSAESISSKSSGGVERGLERSDSLKLEQLFSKDQGSTGADGKNKGMHASSQHLSAMSFSIGDMTETSNLSAVFGDSMRISDEQPPTSSRKKTPQQTTSSSGMTSEEKKMNMSGPLDMSMATFSEGSVGTGLSFHAFDEIENRVDKV